MNDINITTPTVPTSARALAGWSSAAARVCDSIQAARMYLATGEGLPTGVAVDDVLLEAQELAQRLQLETRAAGIHAPTLDHGFEPLDLFALDTPDTRALLALLEQAQAVAERLDAARGRAVSDGMPLAPGESRGTDLAESVSVLALRVRGEVYGAMSRHE